MPGTLRQACSCSDYAGRSLLSACCCLCRINNAGSNAYKYATLADSAEADLINIVETNVLGTMLGTREVSGSGRDIEYFIFECSSMVWLSFSNCKASDTRGSA